MKKVLFISFLCLMFAMFMNNANAQMPGDPNGCCFWLEQNTDQIITPPDAGPEIIPLLQYHLNPMVWDSTDPQYNIGKTEYYYFRFINCTGDPKTKLSIDWQFLVNNLEFDRPLDATPANMKNYMNVEIEWQLPLINPDGPSLPGFQGTGPLLSGMGLNSNINPP
jgi:hypothetical protein